LLPFYLPAITGRYLPKLILNLFKPIFIGSAVGSQAIRALLSGGYRSVFKG
jgi:hypothetical protein